MAARCVGIVVGKTIMVGVRALAVGNPVAGEQAQAVALEEHQAWLAGMPGVVHHGEMGVSIALQLLANIGSGVGGKHLLQVVGRGVAGEGNEQAGKWQSGHGGDRGGWVLPS